MKKIALVSSLAAIIISLQGMPVSAVLLKEKLSGRIVLQVEQKGKAWYVNPKNNERAYLGRPADAFRVMRESGVGITNDDLTKIATSEDVSVTNRVLTARLSGKILLQVQAHGEAWYINPLTLKRYYLSRPDDAFSIMRSLGLGISDADLKQIPVNSSYADPEQPFTAPSNAQSSSPSSATIAPTQQPPSNTSLAGSYRCFSYNVSGGGGGDCRLFAPIVLNANGTYSMSSEKGTYVVKGDVVTLSESKLRGPGTLLEGGMQMRFEYDYNGWHHTITYLKEGGSTSSSAQGGAEISVQLILEYPAKNSGLGGIVTVELVPEGQTVDKAPYKPTAIAQYDGDKKIIGSFYKATNMPKSGMKYTVFTSTGFAATAVGTLDLTTAKTETKATILVTTSGSSSATTSEVVQSTAKNIEVDLKIIYPAKDSALGSMNFVTVVKQGEDPATASYKPTTTALWDGDRTIDASFWKSYNRVKTKAIYTIYTDYGYGLTNVGTLDLTSVTADPFAKTITVSGQSSSSSGTTSTSSTTSSTTPSTTQSSTSSSSGKPCDPNIPSYTKPGCVAQ